MTASWNAIDRPLPVQPVLRSDAALLTPDNGDLHVALSARHVITVVGAPPGLLEWLNGLDGTMSLAQAIAAAPLDASQATVLLAELDRAGLLADANHGLLFRRAEDEQRDALMLAARTRGTAASAGGSRRVVSVSGSTRWVALVTAALQLPQVSLQDRPDASADLNLIVGGVFDPAAGAAADTAMANGWTHLCVLISAVDAALMPLTVPGLTACRRCWALHRDRRAPDWAGSLHPARRPAPPRLPHHHRALVLGLIVEHTLQALSCLQRPTARERYLDLRRGTVELRSIEPHPACGCARAAA